MTELKQRTLTTISENEFKKVKETLAQVAKQKEKNCFSKHNAIAAHFPHLLFKTIIRLKSEGYTVIRHKGFLGFGSSYSVIA